MRFLVGRDAFAEALSSAVKILPARPPIPILDTVLLRVEGQTLEIAATNMDISMREYLSVAEAEDGQVAIRGKTLFDTISSLRGPSLSFTLDDRTLYLRHDGGKYRFSGFSPDEFPRIRRVPDVQGFKIKTEYVRNGLSAVAFCAAREDPRAFLTGVLLEMKRGEIRFVASDSQRLGLWRKEMDSDVEAAAIMSRSMAEMLKNLPGETLDVKIEDDFIYVSHERGHILSRLISGPYAPYESVIPADPGNELVFSAAELTEAFKRALGFTEPPLHTVRLILTGSSGRLEAHSASGSAEEEFACEYSGPDMVLGLSGRMFLEVLRAMRSDKLRMRIYSPTSPFRLEPLSSEAGEEILYLVLPLKLEEEFLTSEEEEEETGEEAEEFDDYEEEEES
ncbi:MAG: DNA polymerase III subunit beta [candidate division WOR-3 bacterium]